MIFLFILFSRLSFAQITCTHPQVCNLVQYTSGKKLDLKNPIEMNVDPHHYEPTTKIIKELISTPYLISAPLELQPWLAGILKERLKSNKPTLVLTNLQSQKYPTSKPTTTAHFWMYPEILCFNLEQIKFFLKSAQFSLKENIVCKKPGETPASLKKITFILTHDALEPLFLTFPSKTINLKTSDHHAEILPHTVKQLETLPNHPDYVWIIEKNIMIPETVLKKYKKSQQRMINFDLDGTMDEDPFKRYETLIEQMAKLNL